MTLTPACFSLLQASDTTPPKFECLFDLTMRAKLDWQQTRLFARQLVKRGLWAVTGREDATRYMLTPDGQALLKAFAQSKSAQQKQQRDAS